MANFGVANKSIPKSDVYDFPAIPHIMNIQATNDNKMGIFIGLYNNESQNKNIEGLLIVPPTPEDVKNDKTITNANAIKYSGCNLQLNTDNTIYNDTTRKTYHINDTIIGVEKDTLELYLLQENTLEPLWSLPQQVFSLLKLGGSTTYGFSISNQKPILLKKLVSNLVSKPPKNEIQEWNLITEDEGLISSNQDNKHSTQSTFVYVPGTSSDENIAIEESIDNSYFTKYNTKYYLKNCQIFPRDDEFHLISYMVVNDEVNKNAMSILARMKKF